MEFKVGLPQISPDELVRYVLHHSGHDDRQAINAQALLDFLKLELLEIDFERDLPPEWRRGTSIPRAVLSYPDRLVAVHTNQMPVRIRFSILHEVGHYLLPSHQELLYLCDDDCLNPRTAEVMEAEANEMAANLLFLGDRFTLEANTLPVSAETAVTLAGKYVASIQATAWRLAAKNTRPVMCMAFATASGAALADPPGSARWGTMYSIASPAFAVKYSEDVVGEVPAEIVQELQRPGRPIFPGVVGQMKLHIGQERVTLRAEFFYNGFNIFCLLTPAA